MGFNIDNFKGALLPNGILKPSKFDMQVFVPPGFSGLYGDGMSAQYDNSFMNSGASTMNFALAAAGLPGVDMAILPVNRYGYGGIEKSPWAPRFGEINVLVYSDGLGKNWTFFSKWLGLISNFDMTKLGLNWTARTSQYPYEMAYKEDFAVNTIITQYREDTQQALQVTLRESYPISISQIKLDWADGANISTFIVVFTFIDWFQTYTTLVQQGGATAPSYTSTQF
jgi:hypothetical protein